MDKKDKRKRRLREWLIAFLITLVLLVLVLGFQFWLTDALHKSFDPESFWRGNLIGDAVGGTILLLIVRHFVKRPDDEG